MLRAIHPGRAEFEPDLVFFAEIVEESEPQ